MHVSRDLGHRVEGAYTPNSEIALIDSHSSSTLYNRLECLHAPLDIPQFDVVESFRFSTSKTEEKLSQDLVRSDREGDPSQKQSGIRAAYDLHLQSTIKSWWRLTRSSAY